MTTRPKTPRSILFALATGLALLPGAVGATSYLCTFSGRPDHPVLGDVLAFRLEPGGLSATVGAMIGARDPDATFLARIGTGSSKRLEMTWQAEEFNFRTAPRIAGWELFQVDRADVLYRLRVNLGTGRADLAARPRHHTTRFVTRRGACSEVK